MLGAIFCLCMRARNAVLALVVGLTMAVPTVAEATASKTINGDDGKNRIVVASLNVARKDGKITGVTATPAKPDEEAKRQSGAADFIAHTNPPGTWVDFGAVATDGAVKINREASGLVLFPYPRDRRFRVSFDLKTLAPAADPATLKIRALASGDQRDLGEVPFKLDGGRVVLETGVPGAGRYVIGW